MKTSLIEQAKRYLSAGKTIDWVANRLRVSTEDLLFVLNKEKESKTEETEKEFIEETNFEEVAPTSKELVEQELIVATSLLAEASKSILAAAHSLNNIQPTEQELLEYIITKTTTINTQTNNPYEHLVDCLCADFMLIKRK